MSFLFNANANASVKKDQMKVKQTGMRDWKVIGKEKKQNKLTESIEERKRRLNHDRECKREARVRSKQTQSKETEDESLNKPVMMN
jgi:hypothetical protein